MRQRRALTWFALWAATLAAGPIAFPADVEGEFVPPGTPEKLYANHAKSVVSVRIAVQRLNDRGKFENELVAVSGFFISENGYVLTFSESSIRGARIWVEKEGVSNLAEPIGWDPRTKIALLQLVRLPAGIEFIPIVAPTERLPIGSIVMGISSPYGLSPSPSLGLVTGYESAFAEHEFPFSYLRTNIPAGPGEYGFPVLRMDGQLVGISVASIPEARSSYIVPSKALKRIVDDFKAHGRVEYGALPVVFRESEDSANASIQVVVSEVRPGSSAARAGLRPGDIVRRIGSTVIRRMHDVRDALFFSRPGEYLTIEIDRDGRSLDWALPVEAAHTEADSDSPEGASAGPSDLSTNKPLPPDSLVPGDRGPQLDLPRDFDPESK
jgi:S1-C subfamily serine protease